MFENKTTFFKNIFWILITLIISNCTKVINPLEKNLGYDYYPVKVGDYKLYHTKTTRYKLDGSVDINKYLVKQIAESSTLYDNGGKKILLERYRSDLSGLKWEKESLWSALITDYNVIVSEGNINYVKLSFPVLNKKKWDGNATNNKKKEMYELTNLGNPYSYDSLSFKNTLTVVQKNLFDPLKITKDNYQIEIFAKNIGLIYKLKINIKYCSNCTQNGEIKDGFIFEQKLIKFEKK